MKLWKTWFSQLKHNVFTILIARKKHHFSLVSSDIKIFMKKVKKCPLRGPGGQRRSGEGPGGSKGSSEGLPGGSLEKLIFFFFGGEFFNGLMKYWCFHFGAILWRAWMHHMYCCFLIVFRSMLFANHWGEFSGNPCVFLTFSKPASL